LVSPHCAPPPPSVGSRQRCLKRIISPFNPKLECVTFTTRLLATGEEVSAWLVKVTLPRF
jgi:hypothetical protein